MSREPRVKSPGPRALSREPKDLKIFLFVGINNTGHKNTYLPDAMWVLARRKTEPGAMSREPRVKSPGPRAVSREPQDLKMILSVCIKNTSQEKEKMLLRKVSFGP